MMQCHHGRYVVFLVLERPPPPVPSRLTRLPNVTCVNKNETAAIFCPDYKIPASNTHHITPFPKSPWWCNQMSSVR